MAGVPDCTACLFSGLGCKLGGLGEIIELARDWRMLGDQSRTGADHLSSQSWRFLSGPSRKPESLRSGEAASYSKGIAKGWEGFCEWEKSVLQQGSGRPLKAQRLQNNPWSTAEETLCGWQRHHTMEWATRPRASEK